MILPASLPVESFLRPVMTRLAELPLKRVAQFNTDGDPVLIRWHKTLINGLMRRTGIGLYGLMWLSFAKGALMTALICWLIR